MLAWQHAENQKDENTWVKALQLDEQILTTPPSVPRASQVKGTKGKPKDFVPLQIRWPRAEVKSAKLAAMQQDFPTVSDFMLACFHAYMKTKKQ
jgi:hypothetical protein